MIADAMVAGEYLKAAAIADTTPTYTIRSVSLEQLASLKPGAAEDKTVQKGVIWFNDTPLGWVMNKTNVECLKAVWGNDTNAWLGKRVTLRTEMTKTGLGIRLKGSPDINREIVAKVKLPKRKAQEFIIVPTGNRRTTGGQTPDTDPGLEHLRGWLAAGVKLGWTPAAIGDLLRAHGSTDGKAATLPVDKRAIVTEIVKSPPPVADPNEPPPNVGIRMDEMGGGK